MADVGFVGLGVMGGRMAARLLAAGHAVTGYNRTEAKAAWLLEHGLRWAETPRAVVERAEVTFSMVTDTEALRAITGGPEGILAGLGPDRIYVDMSTVSPAVSREIAAAVRDRGAWMLDAPVSGSISTLEEGKLSIMAAGDRGAFDRVRHLLEAIGPKVTYVGPNGQAVLMKIATNLSLAVQILAFSEGVLLAEKGGIPRPTAVEVLLNSVIASPMIKYRGPFVLRMPEEAWFDVGMMQKDLSLALEMGRELSVPLPSTAVTQQLLSAAQSLGFGGQDFAALFEVVRTMAGMREAV